MPTLSDYEYRRGSARARGYSAEWDKAAAGFKLQHPLCLGCEAVGRVTATEVVDHVVPHRGDMALFWDCTRWQPACRWHHDAVKQSLEALFTRGAVGEPDLWLNSVRAIELTKRLGAATGDDGWPIDRVGAGQKSGS